MQMAQLFPGHVDLTEDEDSRDTISDVSATPQLSYMRYGQVTGNTPRLKTLSPSTPPPLTPICEINSLRDKRILNNQHRTTVPKLQRIQRSSSQTGITVTDQTAVSQSNYVGANTNYALQNYASFQSNNIASPTTLGKELTIKKNGKTYKIIIPHNVMPSINRSNSSVLVNVPEVGPIMLKVNPQYKDPKVSELEPFSLNFDEIIESASESSSQNNSPQVVSATNLLYDPKFCWIQPRYRHYAYSFTLNFSGFSKTDMQKARRCVRNFTIGVKKLQNLIAGNMPEAGMKNIKNSSKVNNKTTSTLNKNIYDPKAFQKSDGTWLESPEVIDIKKQTQMPKKCEGKVNVQFQRRPPSLRMIKKKGTNVYLKPCYVKINRNKVIEKLVKGQTSLNKDAQCISMNPISSSDTLKVFASKLIGTEYKFKAEMSYIKPLLIINECNCNIVHYKSMFSRTNIVYSVDTARHFPKEMLEDLKFVEAVESGYIKLVDSELLVRYLRGEIGPIRTSGLFMRH